MKKSFGFIMVTAVLGVFLAMTCTVHAQYTVTGDIASGWGTTGGDLWYDVLKETATSSVAGANGLINNPVYGTNIYNMTDHNWIEGDYVLVTGAAGQALYSVGELDPRFGNSMVTLTPNGSGGYDILPTNGVGRSVNGVTNINVVHAADVWSGYASLPASTGVTVNNNGTITTYTKTALATTGTQVAYTATYGGSTTTRTGPTIASVLQAAGVDMANMNQYVIATSTDGYKTILSMYEMTHANANEAANYALAGGQTPHDSGVLDILSIGDTVGGVTSASESSGIRSVMTADVNNGRWGKALSGLQVSAVPEPLTLLLLGFGLFGLVGMTRKLSD